MTNSRIERNVVAGVLVLWLLLWMAGRPIPNGDDAFFFGAALHLSETGELANPWITGWMKWIPGVHTDRFYIHPPFATYVVALWVKLVGASAATMTAYACTVGAFASTGAARLLLRLSCRWPAAVLGALMIVVYVLHRGLRPEPLGLALLLHGQAWMLARRRVPWAGGCALTLASPLCHAFLITMAVPAMAVHLYLVMRHSTKELLRQRLRDTALAGSLIVVLFTAAIRGELGVFVSDLLGHASIVTPPADKLSRFFDQLVVGWTRFTNLFVLAMVGLLAAWSAIADPSSRRMLWISGIGFGAMVTSGIVLYAPFTAIYAVMVACFMALAWSSRTTDLVRFAALTPGMMFTAWGALEHSVTFAANRRATPPDTAAIRRYVAEAKAELVLLDSLTLRYVFDFKPPANTRDIDWSWSSGMSARWWSMDAMENRDLWVINRREGLKLPAEFGPFRPPILLGHEFRSVRRTSDPIVIAGANLPRPREKFPFVSSPAVQR